MSGRHPKPRNKRLETLNLASFTHKSEDGEVDLEVVGRTLDLSAGGILLEIPHPVPSGNNEVEVTLGIREHVIQVRGEIVHQRVLENGHVGLGIAFTNLSGNDSRIISAFLSEDED